MLSETDSVIRFCARNVLKLFAVTQIPLHIQGFKDVFAIEYIYTYARLVSDLEVVEEILVGWYISWQVIRVLVRMDSEITYLILYR